MNDSEGGNAHRFGAQPRGTVAAMKTPLGATDRDPYVKMAKLATFAARAGGFYAAFVALSDPARVVDVPR